MANYQSLTEALQDLRLRGYDTDFEPAPECLYCSPLDLRLLEEDFSIDEAYRFEEASSPGNHVVLYALSSTTGIKGTVLDHLSSNPS